MSKPIKWSDIFDFSNPTDLNNAIKSLNALQKEYEDFIRTATQGSKQLTQNQSELIKSINALQTSIVKLDETNKKDQQTIQKSNQEAKALNATYQAQKKEIESLNVQVAKLTKEKNNVSKKTKDVNNINKEAIKLEAQLGKLTGQQAKETAALRLQIQEKRKALAEEAKVAAGRVTLYQKESKRLIDLRNQYKNVALAQGSNSKAAKGLLKQITPLDNKLKGLDKAVGQNQRSVGAYGEAISSVVPSVGALKAQVLTLFRAIATNPIGAIVVALVALVAAFGKTQKGADQFNKIFEQISATVDVVIGRVATLADAIVGLFKGEEGSLDKIKSSFDDIDEEIKGAVKDAGELADTQVRLRKINLQITEDTARRSREIQQQIIITRDLTKSFAEQREALIKANELELANQADQVRLAKERLLLARQELQFTPESLRTDEQRLKVAEARAEVDRVIAASTAKQRELLNRQNELENRINATIKKRRDEVVKNLADIPQLEEKSGIKRVEIDDEVTNAIIENSKLIGAETKRRLDEQIRAEEEAAEKRKLITETSFEAASITGNALFNNAKINRQNELLDIQAQKDFELALAEGNAEKLAAVEAKFAEKEKQIRIKQVKADKQQALFNIGLNTARGVTAALTSTPPNIPLSIAVGAIGAAQAAAVLSQPLPAFEKGGVTPGGDVVTSERGRELAVTPKGELILTGNKGAEIRSDMPKGTRVFSNPDTERILKGEFDHSAINEGATLKINQFLQEQRDRSTRILASTMRQETDVLIKALGRKIENMPRDQWSVSDGDLKRMSIKGNERKKFWSSKNSM